MAVKLLVTGASGFIGSHCILDLLQHGYEVRGTVRNRNRAKQVRDILVKHHEGASWHKQNLGCETYCEIPYQGECISNADSTIAPELRI